MCVCVRKLHSYVDWYLFLFFAKVITLFCKNVHTLKTICLVLEDNILPAFCHLIFLNSSPIFVGESNSFIVLHGRLWTALSRNGHCFLAFIVSLNFVTYLLCPYWYENRGLEISEFWLKYQKILNCTIAESLFTCKWIGYRKVVSTNTSQLEARFRLYRGNFKENKFPN